MYFSKMNRNSVHLITTPITCLVLMLLILSSSGCDPGSRFSSNKDYNILLISLDAARRDHLFLEAGWSPLTPNLNSLIKNGLTFTQAYCFSGSTPPSMGAMFTSKVPYWPLVFQGDGPRWSPKTVYGFMRFFEDGEPLPGIPDSLPTLPTILQQKGYTTVGLATNAYLSNEFGFERGFDFFDTLSKQAPFSPAEDVAQKVNIYLNELKDDKFFIWAHFMDPHSPLMHYEEYLDEAALKQIPTTSLPVDEWTDYAKRIMSGGRSTDPGWEQNEKDLLAARDAYALQYNAIFIRLDKVLGKIFDHLKALDLWESTLIVIVNDHGDEFMEHGDWSHTGQLYQEIIEGIWIMHNPGLFKPATKIQGLVSHLDLLPTLLDSQKIKFDPSIFDGTSRWRQAQGHPPESEKPVYGILDMRAFIIQDNFKLIMNNDFGKQDNGAARSPALYPEELYDIRLDSHERVNIAEQRPNMIDELQIKFRHLLLRNGIELSSLPQRKSDVSKETLEKLKSLGYIHK